MNQRNITLIGCICFQITLSIFAFYMLTYNNEYLTFFYKEMTLVYTMVGIGAISILLYICIYALISESETKQKEKEKHASSNNR